MSGSEGEAIAAVVVSYQSASTLDACLLRLRAARDVAQIRVVDNGSDDGTLEILQRHALADPRLRFVANPDNPGFSVACNQGAADSDAPWLAFVNPDLQVRPDSLERLRRHLTVISEWDDDRHAEALKVAVEQVRAAAKESEAIGTLGQSRPSVKTMFEEVYATEDWRLVEQRREVGV